MKIFVVVSLEHELIKVFKKFDDATDFIHNTTYALIIRETELIE